jgi:tetratricopeptide (TPR) repeat protein
MEILYLLECGQEISTIPLDNKIKWEYTDVYMNRYMAMRWVYEIISNKQPSTTMISSIIEDNSIWTALLSVYYLDKATSHNDAPSSIISNILTVLTKSPSISEVNEVVAYISENFGLPCYQTNETNYKWIICKLILEAIQAEVDTHTHKKYENMAHDTMQWRILEEIYNNFDNLYQSMLNTAHILRQWMKSPEAALSLYYAATEIQERSHEAWFYVAITLRLLSRKDDALNAYLTSLQICPDNPDSHFNMGNLLLEDYGNPLKALQEYTLALNSHKPTAITRIGKIYNLIAECQYKLGDTESSIQSLNDGMEKDPSYSENYNDMAKHINDSNLASVWKILISYLFEAAESSLLFAALNSIKQPHFIVSTIWKILSTSSIHQCVYSILEPYIIK